MSNPAPAKSNLKRQLMTVIQIVVTVGMLAWVFHDGTQRRQMWEAVTRARLEWLVAGFLCYGIVELLASGRWYILLRVQGIALGWLRLCALFMLGIFFNMFMPGGTGGERTDHEHEAERRRRPHRDSAACGPPCGAHGAQCTNGPC